MQRRNLKMSIKKLFIFPSISIFFLFIAMVFGLMATGADSTGFLNVAICIGCLVPVCTNVISIVGSLKNSRAMVLIGTCLVLFLTFIGNTTMAGSATVAITAVEYNRTLMTLTWTFYGMIWFVSFLLVIGGFISSGRGNGTTFLLASSILAVFFYVGFFLFVLIDFMAGGNVDVNFIVFSIMYGIAVLTVVASTLAVAILGIKQKDLEPDELPGLTHTPKDLKLAKDDPVEEIKRWKELLDNGALTQEEFEEKKAEILKK